MNRVIQSDYYKLTRRLFLGVFKRNLVLCALLFVLTFLMMLGSVNETSFVLPYESLIKMVGIRYVFLVALSMLTLMAAYRIYWDNFKAGGIYTLMMLPMPRRHVYLAYCTVGVASVLMIWTTQVLALTAAYLPVVARCQHAAATFELVQKTVLPFSVVRTNGLFLAAIRSDLFHVLLPQSWQEATNTLLTMLALGFLPAYGALLSGAKRGAVVFMFAMVAVPWTFDRRLNIILQGADITAFVVSTLFVGLILVVAVFDGIRRMNKDANLIGW